MKNLSITALSNLIEYSAKWLVNMDSFQIFHFYQFWPENESLDIRNVTRIAKTLFANFPGNKLDLMLV